MNIGIGKFNRWRKPTLTISGIPPDGWFLFSVWVKDVDKIVFVGRRGAYSYLDELKLTKRE